MKTVKYVHGIWVYGISGIAKNGVRDCSQYHYDKVYLMAGINNLTKRSQGYAVPKYTNGDILVHETVDELYKARTKVEALAREVIVCEMVGLCFKSYNDGMESHAYPEEQAILNSAIVRVNGHVRKMNDDRGLYSPQIADIVHKKRGTNRYQHRYGIALHDGLHFNDNTAKEILDRLIVHMLQ